MKKPLQGSSGKSSKSKKGRSSVSSRSREGGSLPPTKFENVMLLEVRLPNTIFALINTEPWYFCRAMVNHLHQGPPASRGTPGAGRTWPAAAAPGQAWPGTWWTRSLSNRLSTRLSREAAGELQPLLHSTSDSMIRKLVVASDTAIDMEAAQV